VGSLGRRRRGGPGLQPRSTRATTTDGCSSTRIEEGSTEPFRRRRRQKQRRFPAPCPSLGGARPMLLGSARNRAPSLHRGGRHRTHRPRRESGDAPARGTRRGSTEGMAPRRHLTAFTGRARSSHEARARLAPVPKDPRAGTRGGALLEGCPRERDYRSGVPRATGNRRRGERGRRRQPRAEEDSRLAGVPARRNALQRSVAQSLPREAVGHLPASSGRSAGGGRGLGRG
jgi:hypothetical protein